MKKIKDSLPKDYHSPIGKIKQFIAMMLLPYHWARHSGFVEGAKKQRYFEGYADGTNDVHKWYMENSIFELKKKLKVKPSK